MKKYIGLYNELGYSVYIDDVNTEPIYTAGNSIYDNTTILDPSDVAQIFPLDKIKEFCEKTTKELMLERESRVCKVSVEYDKDGFDAYLYDLPVGLLDITDEDSHFIRYIKEYATERDSDFITFVVEMLVRESLVNTPEELESVQVKLGDRGYLDLFIDVDLAFTTHYDDIFEYYNDYYYDTGEPYKFESVGLGLSASNLTHFAFKQVCKVLLDNYEVDDQWNCHVTDFKLHTVPVAYRKLFAYALDYIKNADLVSVEDFVNNPYGSVFWKIRIDELEAFTKEYANEIIVVNAIELERSITLHTLLNNSDADSNHTIDAFAYVVGYIVSSYHNS